MDSENRTGAEVAAFFDRYSTAFAAYDAAALTALFDRPLTVLTAAHPLTHADDAAVRHYVEAMFTTYHGIGLAWPVPAAVWAWPCGPDLARAEVLWLLRSEDRAEIMRFSTSYVLRRDAVAGWKLAVVIAYEEPGKLPGSQE
ncbi:hypothetical protein GE253_16935 [Niveispirillum sp. SYP-B3756]|uniref:nuclear transport factor 2 family protein n=1 Tax=Niveispirillum sp. SYP-B3756 TaxID=2662178 RepID=UPI0012927E20|nr:nuclear transport factor 2 family protein [Niveispirillum sp. SYP-B3756]MQP67015.1 hypothetical protein [Niveispirillum sp. SYP-B3756]